MTIWKHTKSIIIDTMSVEGCTRHEDPFFEPVYLDWYYDQIDSGLVDPNLYFKDICQKISDTEYKILVTDQTQADSYIAIVNAIVEQIGYAVNVTVVDYTE